ncbi:pyridoxamine 5'-phosphate oxidase family protein [Agrococcus baldri]|uniref:Pyridoxamine 5'-phosphate oxidase n=1 Tax=Agrococcus baldri TaxID=153730 RepID=A0AA87RLF1_9MICO|nr:pyridoxamine 5'-phosphate oxidase family protein [Agrococcus baldri]GEK81203.1 hypothetical protein ABA31_25540 [Agrococcus baldri]
MALPAADRDALFASAATPILAIERPGRAPVAVPVWHDVDDDGCAWILTPDDSLKARLLRASGRATLVVDELEPEVRYAAAECELVDERPGTMEDAERLARRYLPEAMIEGYLAFRRASIGPTAVFRLRPVAWLSASMG